MLKLFTYVPLLVVPLWLWVVCTAMKHYNIRKRVETLEAYDYHNVRYYIYNTISIPLGVLMGLTLVTLSQQY